MADHENARQQGYQIEAASRQHLQYVHPTDGRLMPLVVQSFQEPQYLPRTLTWTRMGKPPSRVPSLFKVALWIGSSTIQEGTGERVYTPKTLATTAAKMAVASPIVYCLMSGLDLGIPLFNDKSTLTVELDLRYDGVFNRDPMLDPTMRTLPDTLAREEALAPHQRPHYISNIRLNSHVTARRTDTDLSAPWISRTESTALSLRPRYLCFVKDFEEGTYETVQVSDYVLQHGEQVDTEFIFVSYTRMQFRVATGEEIDTYDYPDEATREANRKVARQDRAMLIRWAIDAVDAAGKQAFWLDFECVRDTDGQARSTSSSEDVYRICDIVRASHSMIIGIGPPADDRVSALLTGEELPENALDSQTSWLRQWGSRLWTLPELLLCPSEYRIKLFVAGDSDEPRELAKRNFAERAWDDAETVKDLVNHYEGSAILSPLLLIATALECFSRRKTDQFSPGDIAYAIMGLLPDRQRPKVNQTDSGFQAFARLSLAHDDGRFLERLICLLPPQRGAKWYDTDDLWGARLKDVLPACQVVDTGGSDSIILDGAFGATINWDEIDASASLILLHEYAMFILMAGIGCSIFFPKGWLMLIMVVSKIQEHMGWRGPKANETSASMVGFTLLIPCIYAVIGPLMILWRSKETRRSTKASLIGIEGFVDVGQVERYLYGYNFGRLTQTSNIPLYRDAVGDPLYEESGQGGLAFTLVDTHSLTVTHFRANRPPVAMFVCGQEGGMQRALLCSYDAETNTYCRETVLKVHNKVLEQMRRVDRFRFALEYPRSGNGDDEAQGQPFAADDIAAESVGVDGTSDKVLDDGKKSWRLEWSFVVATLLAFNTYHNFYELRSLLDIEGVLTIPYGISFVVTQLPANYVLSKVPLTRIVPSLALLKGLLVCFYQLFLPLTESPQILTNYAILEGFTDSAFLAVFVLFIWSWFTLERLPVRMLTLACSLAVMLGLYRALPSYSIPLSSLGEDLAPVIYAGLCFSLSCGAYTVITTPGEVAWLSAHKRVLHERRAADHKWNIQGEGSEGPALKHVLLSSPQPWLFLGANLLNAVTTLPGIDYESWTMLKAVEAALMLLLTCVVLYKIPRATAPMVVMGLIMSLVASIIVHLTQSSLSEEPTAMMLRTQIFIAPLLWALIAPTTSTLPEGRWSLTLSLMGLGAGRLLTILEPGVLWTAPLMVTEALLVGCIWFVHYRREMKTVRLLRARSMRGEYRDDIDAM